MNVKNAELWYRLQMYYSEPWTLLESALLQEKHMLHELIISVIFEEMNHMPRT